MLKNFKRVLVLAPHTDDGELGAGGLIARLIEGGSEVHYVAFSNAEESVPAGFPKDILETEVKNATAVLGIEEANVSIVKFPVRKFNYHRQEILEHMIVLRRELSPDLILTPSHSDVHQDHAVIAQEGLRAFKNSTVLGYELVWNNMNFDSRLCVTISQDHLSKKCNALLEYKSQGQRSYMDPKFIESLARVRGMAFGVEFAELYELVRMKL